MAFLGIGLHNQINWISSLKGLRITFGSASNSYASPTGIDNLPTIDASNLFKH
ncbi:5304_t:CDS:2 [Ambispora gerdemannii]|uniref:5304_t:CDS:1 n=1 Tax=Ambispora gerdemannii TaxID=144530 RepID=A0A9N8V0C1_9GLOM|nr:5304_t:CDS:2 [Ambispora gerdemannii]